MNSQTPPFDDPPLKEALRALSVGSGASDALRARVSAAMRAVPVGDSARPLVKHGLSARRLLRIAAVILAGVGVGTLAIQWYDQHQRDAELNALLNAPARSLWQVMVDLHDAGVASSSCHSPLTAPLTDPAALAAEGTKQLNFPVPAPKLGGDWKLDAASYATLNRLNGARFHFTQGAHTATIITLPESAWQYRTGDTYATTVAGHAIAGFVKNGTLTCVVGDPTLPPADVQQLAEQLRAQ